MQIPKRLDCEFLKLFNVSKRFLFFICSSRPPFLYFFFALLLSLSPFLFISLFYFCAISLSLSCPLLCSLSLSLFALPLTHPRPSLSFLLLLLLNLPLFISLTILIYLVQSLLSICFTYHVPGNCLCTTNINSYPICYNLVFTYLSRSLTIFPLLLTVSLHA